MTAPAAAEVDAVVRRRAAELIAAALHGPAGIRWVFHPDSCPSCRRAVAVADQLADHQLLTGAREGWS